MRINSITSDLNDSNSSVVDLEGLDIKNPVYF